MRLTDIIVHTYRAVTWVRARVTKARVVRAAASAVAIGLLAVTGEAVVRGHLVPPAERAPSALYTRPVAWADGADVEPVAIGSISGNLGEDREPVELQDVPQHLIDAVIAVEDKRFYSHHGLDPLRIAGALVANVRAGGVSEGGSTITQQLAKNLFLTASRSPVRKIREAALATALEMRYSKRQILEAYLNEAYFGQDGAAAIRGVGAAAQYYFGKPVSRLSLAESALLAGMIHSPNRLAPTRHPEDAAARRNLVLGLMVAQKRISPAAVSGARDARVSTRSYPASAIDARYFRDFVATSVGTDLPERGAAIFTTLDAALQQSAERAVTSGLRRLGRPGAQAALVAIDPRTGDVLAMVGGGDYGASQFNRATDALRQPGSAFKPLVALAALQAGPDGTPAFTLASMIDDEPLSVPTPEGTWQPVDYDGGYRGPVTFREAMEQSLNLPFARIGLAVGPGRIVATAQRLGITSRLRAVPSIALGSSEVSLLELVRAYGVLAAEGNLAATRTIMARRDPGRPEQLEPVPVAAQVADSAATYLVTSALMGVVQRGTGRGLAAYGFGGDIAGKTGTSNDWRDAWFIAYSPTIAVGAWVGYDDGKSLRLAGASAALPIVGEFFDHADIPGGSFDMPAGVERAYLSPGAWGWCDQPEYFLEGTAPPGSGCGFRAFSDDARGWISALRDQIRRMVRGRMGDEGGARPPQVERPR